MSTLDATWVKEFDAEMKRLYCVDHNDIGWDGELLLSWSDIPPCEAAERFGEKYDLIRYFP